ncbi:Regulator of nonsense transcripts 1 [Mycena venus]|uniref:Regulator of nonsense transcripts 1 n=1 Tax=Mycena venus TaxID=2733690 RepID=A0A8H7CHP0_9AGAR|nr:Regulator of nonsense transcripts 1 [Mycena venus]
MSSPPFTVVQDIFKASHPPILVTNCPLASVTRKIYEDFLHSAEDGVLGVAPAYGTNCVLSILAFASVSKVLLVQLPKRKEKAKQKNLQGRNFLEALLLSVSHHKFAFQMDVVATSLYFDFGICIRSAVDLLSVSTADRHSLEAIIDSIGGVNVLHKENAMSLFTGDEKLNKSTQSTHQKVALQAWVAWRAAALNNDMTALLKAQPRIDTSSFNETRLSVFAKMVREARCLSALKPSSLKNEIADDFSIKKGQLHVTCTRFKNRVQSGDPRAVKIEVIAQGQRTVISSRPAHVNGRAVKLKLDKPLPLGGSIRLTTIGKEPLTGAEKQRADIILGALQKMISIAEQSFFRAIFLPQETPVWRKGSFARRVVPIQFSRALNDSQKTAVAAILSNDPINVIHGPPGTGKTTVIAAAVTSISAPRSGAQDRTMWLVAQSNVAVKNIAEKLASVNMLDFKLIVSKDFHYDWHEHLYEKINPRLIRSDSFIDDLVAAERQLEGSKVILCTLTMLSHPRISTITRIVPLQTVIVDEASQVEIGNFLPMISLYSHSLRKLVFIGDDKQLAPYGQGDVPSLQSIFEMEHLRKNAIFLDTQCTSLAWLEFSTFTERRYRRSVSRMPIQLGTFIGKHVYANKLKTVHKNTAQCCQFIDVKKGKEVSAGSSWINEAEIWAVMLEARKCVNKGRSYRIITPYDAQRGRIEAALKKENIPWEDKVFCVDSFQGNEADYIILSIVRTEKIGFLAAQRRVNVMLTRCKMGMKICTSRRFVEGAAKDTLVGRLASEIGQRAWEA